MPVNNRLRSIGLSSFQGVVAGLGVGLFGPSAFPVLLASVPLDICALRQWRLRSVAKDSRDRMSLARGAFLSHGVNLAFSIIGIISIAPYSPMGTEARNQYFKVIATPVIAQNTDALGKQSRSLLDSSSSYWLNSNQKSKLMAKLKIVDSVNTAVEADRALYAEGMAIAGQRIDESNFRALLDRAYSISSNPRAALIVPASIRSRIAQKAKDALVIAEAKEKEAQALAEAKERERLAKLPKKYKATMTNCFVDAPCESFERVAVMADGKVTVGDFTCLITGQGPDDQGYGACSVAMDGARPISMRQWDPKDGFETTRVSIGESITEGTYDPEMEANPYVKLQRERVSQILQEFEREKENAKKNCKGLRGAAWTACAGSQSGN